MAVVTVMTLAVLVAAVIVSLTTTSSRAPILGAYAGYENVSGVSSVTEMTGARLGQAMDFLDPTTWDRAVESAGQMAPVWNRTGYLMTWGVPMLPTSEGSLARGATGAYDGYFATIARTLVADHQGSSIIRLGWEFNGTWFPWSAATCPSCFVTYWRHIVTTMRSVPGSHFLFEWNPTAGTYALAPPEVYPGDSYVDIIGLDVYDNVPGNLTPTQRFDTLSTEPYGLNWLIGFATAHGKRASLPEWGLGYPPDGGGDDPYFITHMAEFIREHSTIESALYWNYGTSQLSHSPRSRAAFAAGFAH